MNNKKGKQTKNINDERNHAFFSVCHRRFCFHISDFYSDVSLKGNLQIMPHFT